MKNRSKTYHLSFIIHAGLIILLMIVLCSDTFTQQRNFKTDTLRSSRSIDEQILKLNKLANSLRSSDPASAKKYALEALKLADENAKTTEGAKALRILGDVNYLTGFYDSSIAYYHQAAAKFLLTDNAKGLAHTQNNLGIVFLERNQYDSALNYFNQSLITKKALNDSSGISKSLINIGTIYVNKGDFTMAFAAYEEAMRINELLHDYEGIMDCHINTGVVYHGLDQFDLAIFHFKKALEIAKNLNDQYTQAICLNNIGDFYFRLGNYSKAQEFIAEGFYIREALNDRSGMITSMMNMSKIFEKEGNYQRANEIYIQALAIANELGDVKKTTDLFSSVCYNLRIQGKFEEALSWAQKSIELARKIESEPQILMNLKELVFIFSAMKAADSADKYFNDYIALHEKLKMGVNLPANNQKDEKIEYLTFQAENYKNILLVSWILILIITGGLVVFIFVLLAMSVIRRKQRKKIHRKSNI
ncbi:MAG TPA: tetratricopeptide repeat protein [Bacteroidales bacterium]|nr:tetratricopeptide repeat protein [Bacteroidales bacterium]